MSRGPGVWQRRILTAVAQLPQNDIYTLRSIVEAWVSDPQRSDHVSARRAAKRLAEDGRIKCGVERFIEGEFLVVGRGDCTYKPEASTFFDGPVWYTLVNDFDRECRELYLERLEVLNRGHDGESFDSHPEARRLLRLKVLQDVADREVG